MVVTWCSLGQIGIRGGAPGLGSSSKHHSCLKLQTLYIVGARFGPLVIYIPFLKAKHEYNLWCDFCVDTDSVLSCNVILFDNWT